MLVCPHADSALKGVGPVDGSIGPGVERVSGIHTHARRLSAAAIIGDAHVSHKIEEELRQRLARALAARTLDALQGNAAGGADAAAQTQESLAEWPPLPGREAGVTSGSTPMPAGGAEGA